ncbi:expressed unknown protein [Seminavis robusta]|uniref:Uncharacterized protein n=1 Tax=Seminavis robusta TaxID=568900 RepID=A0A9N8H756_9STRA|nr:expressed unknown protein [Seminavis robusta]|eukprot:Sro167_g074620.1 n/a (227) ;mRNA; r:90768-91448
MCIPALTTTFDMYVTPSSSCSRAYETAKRPQQESGYTSSITMLPPRSYSPKKRVAFTQTCSVQFVEPHSAMTASERDAYWYKAAEINAFHKQARETCRKLRTSSTSLDTPVVCRGLELRKSPARQKRKLVTLQFVVSAQRKLSDPRRVALLAAKCSNWAAQVARVEAQRDFIRAYAGDECLAFLPPLPPMTPFPVPFKGQQPTSNKRANAPERAEQRCVHRRISVC